MNSENSESKPRTTILPAGQIAVGHLVIVGDYDRPSAGCIAVITKMESKAYTKGGMATKLVWFKYLRDDPVSRQFNRGNSGRGAMCLSDSEPTPVGEFGVSVIYDPDSGKYWCQRHGPSIAKYRKDGKPRDWQEQFGLAFFANEDVVKVAVKQSVDAG
jgi:hypothetical protein